MYRPIENGIVGFLTVDAGLRNLPMYWNILNSCIVKHAACTVNYSMVFFGRYRKCILISYTDNKRGMRKHPKYEIRFTGFKV